MSSQIEIVGKNGQEAAKLQKLLNDFYTVKIKGKSEGKNIDTLKTDHGAELESIIHQYMVDAYLLGARYVNKKLGVLPFYNLSKQDSAAIENTERTIIDKFWFKINEAEIRNTNLDLGFARDISLTVSGEKEKSALDTYVYIGGIANNIAFGAFVLGEKLASKQIIEKVETPKKDAIIAKWVFVFKTKNDLDVDPIICRPLEGLEFELDDPAIPELPLHIHCRCSLPLVRKKI